MIHMRFFANEEEAEVAIGLDSTNWLQHRCYFRDPYPDFRRSSAGAR